jgi:Phosphotransferase system, mannose/fructose-specific component IIA
MFRIVIITHGEYGGGILSAIELIMGKQTDVYTIRLQPDQAMNEYYQNLKQLIIGSENHDDGTLALVDVFGGTPFNTVARIIGEVGAVFKIRMVTGINLPMMLELLNDRENLRLDEAVTKALAAGKDGIRDFSVEFKS